MKINVCLLEYYRTLPRFNSSKFLKFLYFLFLTKKIKKLKTKLKKTVLLCSLILFYGSVFSQSHESKKDGNLTGNNIIHLSLAPDIAYNAATIFFDRIISQNGNLATFFRIGYGGWSKLLIGGGSQTLAQGGIILGSNNRKFEIALGAAIQNEKTNNIKESNTIPAISLGLRSQKPGKRFVFRAGIGYPEGIYVGVGHSL